MVMVDFLPLIVVGFAASLGLTPLTRQIASRVGLMDKPNPRKVHRAPMPLMGGLAIYGAFLLALLLFQSWPQHIVELGAILVGATFLALIGLLDDRLDLSPWIKFPAQFGAAGLVIVSGIQVDLFSSPWLDIPITVIWIVGIVNAVNFLDNMDGLAAGISAICALFLFILAYSQGQELVSALAAALGGSAIGFLVYNFNPATTFMGDMGALVLGFVLAVLGIKLRFPTHPLSATWMIPILVFGMPIFDTTLVVFTRLREGRSPFKGGKDHTSHRLVALGFSHRLAVMSLYLVCVLLGIAAIVVSQTTVETARLIGVSVAFLGVAAFTILEVTRIRQRRSGP
jgi:UDP-GlcNAc:undecaprenyl-phosphate/decaprenyl-phosphate GlcNAc-1-phosphate transferase